MDDVIRKVRETVVGVGEKLLDNAKRCKWKIEWLMFALDTLLIGDSEKKLQMLFREFGNVCKRRKLTVNVN